MFDKTFEYGSENVKGKKCSCATREDILDCLKAHQEKNASIIYEVPFAHCRVRAKQALNSCCLDVGEEKDAVSRGKYTGMVKLKRVGICLPDGTKEFGPRL